MKIKLIQRAPMEYEIGTEWREKKWNQMKMNYN